ncbi:MAG: hypothetical protein NTW21_28440 [Verrucomicrobia bacterium]|nr:hypothetical protein [Verrucomicrobiota bacterium]
MYLCLDATQLFTGLRTFGRTKSLRLIEILEAATDGVEPCSSNEEDVPPTVALTCPEILYLWGVPSDFPLDMLPLSTRLLNFCEQQEIGTITTLLDVWGTLGRSGLLAHENIGRRTVDELQHFARAIARADADAVRRWLPLNDRQDGLCLRRAFGLSLDQLKLVEVPILTSRLVDNLSLEECADVHGITRERVRQMEGSFLRDVRRILGWFSSEMEAILDAWMGGLRWHSFAGPQATPDGTTLIIAAIEACLDESPQGVARRLVAESAMDSWLEAIATHPDLYLGGVDLQSYLDDTVPPAKHVVFIRELFNTRGISIDHASGLVKPCNPSVIRTVRAILQQEEDPIPLTWLAQRVQSVLGFEEFDSDFIFQNRYRWSSNGWLELDQVLWGQ